MYYTCYSTPGVLQTLITLSHVAAVVLSSDGIVDVSFHLLLLTSQAAVSKDVRCYSKIGNVATVPNHSSLVSTSTKKIRLTYSTS
jgi:hypothetical protein